MSINSLNSEKGKSNVIPFHKRFVPTALNSDDPVSQMRCQFLTCYAPLSATSLRRVCAGPCGSRRAQQRSPWSRQASSRPGESCRCVQLRSQPSRRAAATSQTTYSQSPTSGALAIASVARTSLPVARVSIPRGFFHSSEYRRCDTCQRTAPDDVRTTTQSRCPSQSPSRHVCYLTGEPRARWGLHAYPPSARRTSRRRVWAYRATLHDLDLRRCPRGSAGRRSQFDQDQLTRCASVVFS